MGSAFKPVIRRAEDDPETVPVEQSSDESEGAANPLEAAIEAEEVRSRNAFMLLTRDTIEQKIANVERMFDQVAELNSQLSSELCKEDHGKYMALWARIGKICQCIQTRLLSVERDLNALDIPVVPWRTVFMGFVPSCRRIIRASAERIKKRDTDLSLLSKWQSMLASELGRPGKIHEEAVQHEKRLLMYEHQGYRQLLLQVQQTAKELKDENREHGNSYRYKALKDAAEALQVQMPIMDKEFYDKALKKVQESDNGPRPK